MAKIVRLTERDLTRIVKRVIKEQNLTNVQNDLPKQLKLILDKNPNLQEKIKEFLKSTARQIPLIRNVEDLINYLSNNPGTLEKAMKWVKEHSIEPPLVGAVKYIADLIQHYRNIQDYEL